MIPIWITKYKKLEKIFRMLLLKLLFIRTISRNGWLKADILYQIKPVVKSYVSATLTANFKNDVVPAGNKAMLILSNGSHIVLDSA